MNILDSYKHSHLIKMTSSALQRVILLTCISLLLVDTSVTDEETDLQSIAKSSFPKGFSFGAAGSAYQYEGGANEGGRGPSIWDKFSHIKGKIDDGSNGDIAADSFHRYKEDVKLLKDMGMDSYRFSISWSRVLPKGTLKGGINKEGVNYYNNLINEMTKQGIKPFVTLFHWDLPQALEDKYKGFLSKNIVNDFADYAELCFKEFGDRVKHWITLNEPWTFASQGYDTGVHAPGRCSKIFGNCSHGNSATEPYIVAHNLILAHATAVDIYKRHYQASQKGEIGITIVSHWMLPYSNKSIDKEAANRALDFMYGWFMDPIIKGTYPITMRRLVGYRLPGFTKQQTELVKGSYDFIGLNYYTARYASHVPHLHRLSLSKTDYNRDDQANLTEERNGVLIGQRAASDWLYVYPQGLHDILLYTKQKYGNPPVFITENGVDERNEKGANMKDALNDEFRVRYYKEHLKAMKKAMEKGANVKGYFAWSLLDNFEWTNGYTVRFGLYYVDFNNGTLNRYPKKSVHWFKSLMLK